MFNNKVVILDELEEWIPPLSENNRDLLRLSIKDEGLRDPIIVWKKGDHYVIVDGHNRYRILEEEGILDKLKVNIMSFNDINEVKEYMLVLQLGRRNLSPFVQDMLIKRLMDIRVGQQGVNRFTSKSNVTKDLAKEQKTSVASLYLAKYRAEALEHIKKSSTDFYNRIISGEANIKKKELVEVGKRIDEFTQPIMNEDSLYYYLNPDKKPSKRKYATSTKEPTVNLGEFSKSELYQIDMFIRKQNQDREVDKLTRNDVVKLAVKKFISEMSSKRKL